MTATSTHLAGAIAVVICALPAAAQATPGQYGAYASQPGINGTLDLISGCISLRCGDGPGRPGPDLAFRRPGTVFLTFDDPVSELTVRTSAPGAPAQTKTVSRIDETHWTVLLDREPEGSQLDVFAKGGPSPWDALYRARLTGSPTQLGARITGLRPAGRSLTFKVRVTGTSTASLRSYVTLKRKRVSTIARTAAASTAQQTIRLNAKTWRAARRTGVLAVEVTVAGERVTVYRALR